MIDFFKMDKTSQFGYIESVKIISSLSRLFSDSDIPYLHYRVMENLFCSCFKAKNISRSDIAYDAKIESLGIGLKTFICKQNSSIEKIAEFNRLSNAIKSKNDDRDLVVFLAECRNNRIKVANENYGISKSIYHIIARREKELVFFETDYDEINISNIRNIKRTDKSLTFNDDKNEYYFNFSKSVLQKKFYIPLQYSKINVDIIENPFDVLKSIKKNVLQTNITQENSISHNYVVLPLFSLRGEKNVPERSQLNQWNAGGRERGLDEIYIPIPKIIHKLFPNFFPPRDEVFALKTPLNEILNAKVCQDGGKALMTNPNSALSKWLLRKILKLKSGQLLTLEKLEMTGFDSVIIAKQNKEYSIDIMPLGSYEVFLEQNKIPIKDCNQP